jgi:predicted  nucleic acid-binding Zn-ribbon protein
LSELQRRKRATLARIEANARDGETLRRRVKELEQRVARDRERVKAYDKVIQEGESSLDRILESSEFLLSALARETQTFEDDEDDVEE